jgi:hypothetical protein
METKSKILLAIFFLLIVIAFFATYYRTMILRDFPVTNTGSS